MKFSFHHKLLKWLKPKKSKPEEPCKKETKAGVFSFQIVDADSGSPLEGAEFTMYCEEETIAVAYSDHYGRVTFPCVHPGIYTMRETNPPEGHSLKKTEYNVTVDVFCLVTIEDLPARMFKVLSKKEPVLIGPLVLYKRDMGTGEGVEGAKFRLYNEGFDKTEVSGEDGELDFGTLTPGTYSLREVEPPVGYMVLDYEYTVSVKQDGGITIDGVLTEDFNLTNAICTGFGIFRKTKEDESVEGAVYELRFKEETIQTASTNENGYVSFECFLPGNYTLVETFTPEGFKADEEEHDVVVGTDGKVTVDGVETFERELLA